MKPRSLRHRLKEATNQEILQAAETVLGAHGVANTTMAKVAKQAGVSVGTLYNYFADRDELIRVLHQTRRQQFYETLSKVIEDTHAEAFEVRLTSVIQSFIDQFESHRDFMRIIFSGEVPAPVSPPRPPMLDFAMRLKPLLQQGIKQKVLAGDADLMAAVLVSSLRGAVILGISENKPLSAMVPTLASLFLNGAGRRA